MGDKTVSLNQLKQSLLFNRLIDVWFALCEEKGWDWYDVEGYKNFMIFAKSEKLPLQKQNVCIKEEGKKAAFVAAVSENRISHDTFESYAVRLDEETLSKIRSFQK